MTRLTGSEVLLEVLAAHGVHHIFGNPGTTELPLIDELAGRSDPSYVLALQENTAVGMADGYAQATGRPAFVNLHTAAGLGGGIGNLTNALANRTPMVVTAGQQDRRHLAVDPILSGDLTGIARGTTKWQHEVRNLGELATILHRAFNDAASPPPGPVFVSLPLDVLEEAGDLVVPPPSHIDRGAVAGGLPELADLLSGPGPTGVAMVVGDGIAASGALPEVVAIAEALGCKVFGAPLYSNLNFPTAHVLWSGMLPMTAVPIAALLAPFERVLVIGTKAFLVYHYSPGSPIPPATELLHLDCDPGELGRNHPTRFATYGDVKASLAALLPLVAARVEATAAARAVEQARAEATGMAGRNDDLARSFANQSPMHPMAAVHALFEGLPPGAAVVDESITTGLYVRSLWRTASPGTYYFTRGGGLGWGMPASLGVRLAREDQPVLCVVGDGSAMYSIQSLWTAAHSRIPVVFAVVDNRRYAILQTKLRSSGGRAAATGDYVGMDLDDPPIDFLGLARSLGVDSTLAEKPEAVTEAARAAFDSGRPHLVHIPIAAP
ncbi:MAG: thiamine pyrophosphate-binding protein [Acidimicrobiia bacterium]